jgi:hypothetical protein
MTMRPGNGYRSNGYRNYPRVIKYYDIYTDTNLGFVYFVNNEVAINTTLYLTPTCPLARQNNRESLEP